MSYGRSVSDMVNYRAVRIQLRTEEPNEGSCDIGTASPSVFTGTYATSGVAGRPMVILARTLRPVSFSQKRQPTWDEGQDERADRRTETSES